MDQKKKASHVLVIQYCVHVINPRWAMHNATSHLSGVGRNECVQTLFVDKATGHTYTKMTRQGLGLYPLSTQNYMNMVANKIHYYLRACMVQLLLYSYMFLQ